MVKQGILFGEVKNLLLRIGTCLIKHKYRLFSPRSFGYI